MWLIYLAAGGVAMIAYTVVPVGIPTGIIDELVGLSSVGAVLLGIHRPTPADEVSVMLAERQPHGRRPVGADAEVADAPDR